MSILGYLISYKETSISKDENRCFVKTTTEFSNFDRVKELENNNNIKDLVVEVIYEGDHSEVNMDKERIEEELNNILETMEEDFFDVISEEEIKKQYLNNCESNEECMAIRFYFELFRAIDILYMKLPGLNYRDPVFEVASNICFLDKDQLIDLYFNKYNAIAERMLKKEYENMKNQM